MKTAKSANATKPRGWLAPMLLAAVLAVLFCKSFLPGIVHFSNDGPLGQQASAWMHLPTAFVGSWCDLSYIGGNAGLQPPGVSGLVRWILGPLGYAKFLAPIALFILGLGAWAFFRQLKFSALAATLGALAAALNSAFFSTACWGVAPQQIAIGMVFFALALIVSNAPETPVLVRWARLGLAGLCVGVNVMEAADIGAILSLFVAAFAFFWTLAEENTSLVKKLGRGIGRVAVIAVFAGFIAVQTVVSLVGSQITGIAGTGQDAETKAQHWDWATQWSFPKVEAFSLFVPGLFGYRMDTPKDMPEFLQDAYKGGNYWGGVGRDPAIDRYFDSGGKSAPPNGFMRFTGGGGYAGILVVLIAIWAMAQSLRRENSAFTGLERRFVWFWSAILICSLLLSFGRFAPFYKLMYLLPYFSTIRNPTKFLLVFSVALVVLFGYGVQALNRRYLSVPSGNSGALSVQLKNWWAKVRGFDRNWTSFCVVAVIGSICAWGIYAMQQPSLVKYLQTVGFGGEMAKDIATFSLGQVGWFILFFVVTIALITLVIAGVFAGKRAKLGGILLVTLLVVDLGRANLPWIVHWDYAQKYESNPIVDFLKDKPYEHRVAGLPFRSPEQFQLFDQLYRIEWMQHHFPYYNIQSLDNVQLPRMPVDMAAFEGALDFHNSQENVYLITRRWQLTNTRYLLGPAGFLEVLNEQLDPVQRRFRIVQRFDVLPKPGISQPTRLEEMTAVPGDSGAYALFDFTGALPRVKLYSNWQVSTNDADTLKAMGSRNFDATQTVLVATPPPPLPAANDAAGTAGTVTFKSYAPKDIVFDAQVATPSVLLFNDKYDPNWRVSVDGQPADLLRCNFIMRGVYLAPGTHKVEFKFSLPAGPLYVTLTAIGVGILLCGVLLLARRRKPWLE